jgi:transketolase
VFVVEHQYARGGQADLIARHLLEMGPWTGATFRGVGLSDVPRCGTEEEVLAAHGLRPQDIADMVRADVLGLALATGLTGELVWTPSTTN